MTAHNRKNIQHPPTYSELNEYVDMLFPCLFPELSPQGEVKSRRDALILSTGRLVEAAAAFVGAGQDCRSIAGGFALRLDSVVDMLRLDLRAALDGDPAATCEGEILLCYPGFYAVTVYRVAHLLHELGAPLLPRLLTEYAHRQTGIDIHPGASIGKSFFIDHGTGVVIGETAEVGDCVKLYQGVTLGAKSIRTDRTGRAERGGKRHPTVKDRVVIYAGATVLGGDTVIGEGAVIGAGVFVTSSVPPDSTVIYLPECKKKEKHTPPKTD